jgi:hypothetical protein
MAKELKPAFVDTLRHALKLMDQLEIDLSELQAYFEGDSPELIRASIIWTVAEHYKVPVVEGQRKAAGTYVLDKTASNYETAKKRLQRLVLAIIGNKPKASQTPTAATKKRVDVVAELVDLIKSKQLTPAQLKALKAAI